MTGQTLEVGIGVVKENDADRSAIVRVDDACADINGVLPRQPRARRNAAVRALRHGDRQVRFHELFAARLYGVRVRARQIITRRTG